MLALSEEVVRLVVGDVRRWRSRGLDFRVAMNFAPPELLSGILLPRLFDAVAQAGLARESIVVEVTEDSFISDPERARTVLQDIRSHGLQIAIDDYGTGFSSLSYLRDLPVNELKIDRSFVSTMTTDRRSRMIIASTVHMAHALDLRLVAEGVEDATAAVELAEMDVDVLQGYHIARPMPARDLEGWVRRHAVQVAPSGPARRVV
jgi:EAL domain-containing protein (putative c-di-GMP-specific phosphodiesterase class I)